MKRILIVGLSTAIFLFFTVLPVWASETDGTIDATYKYAWGENIGWINFGCDNCGVRVTDSGLSGYAFGENIGWINLEGVSNDGEGNLSGFAWGENVGFIKFDPANGGVSINSSGEFSGEALGENIGWIIFGGDYAVKTDWRPLSARSTSESEESTPGSGSTSGSASGRRNAAAAAAGAQTNFFNGVETALSSIAQRASDLFGSLAFLKSEPESPAIPSPDTAAAQPSEAFSQKWSLLPAEPISQFLFAALPSEIRDLAKKFPELNKTFKDVGITNISDLQKLKNAKFTLAGLNARTGLGGGMRVPISSLSESQKKLVPGEVVFAKAGELMDYDIQLSINQEGVPEQKITTIVGKSIDLAVKTDKPAESVKGYMVVKNLEREQARKSLPVNSALAAPIFAVLGKNVENGQEVEIEERLVVSKFDYNDDDKDGIYTASIVSPLVSGEYEIISIIDYKDPALGKKELRLVTVVDPEGYIYEKSGNKEARIPDAKVSLYQKNTAGRFDLWKASDYQQTNPQKTDKSGSYSFLVPEGVYKLSVVSDEHYAFESEEFEVEEGRGVHMNVELKPKSWWRGLFNLFK